MPATINDQILNTASLAGKIMLESGGEIYRVEQTVNYLCRAYGAVQSEVFATPTTIILSLVDGEGCVHSMVRRIAERSVHLGKVEAVNDLSRAACTQHIPLDALTEQLEAIRCRGDYRFLANMLASGVGAGAFAVFFGGGLSGLLCGLALGALQRGVLWLCASLRLGSFVVNILGGAFAALGGLACNWLGLTAQWQPVTIGVLMLMVPGMMFTNALRDVAAGELVAGISRVSEAFCVAAALACGAAVVYGCVQLMGGSIV